MKISDEWWTAPAEGTDGRLVIVTGRDDIDDIRTSGKYIYRIDVSWRYNALPAGMPEPADAALMEQVDDALKEAFRKDPAGVITGIYTGDGERDWVIYTRSLHIFSKIFNRALEELPTIPFVIDAESDPEWEEYRQMRDETYIAPGE